jgi:hypothetical protein
MNYQSINKRVITKYIGGFSLALSTGRNITIHNRKGEPMFTVRPSGRVFCGNEELTTIMQSAVMFKGTEEQNTNFIRLNQESYQ